MTSMENKQEQGKEKKKCVWFGQDGYFLEGFDCLTVITVRERRPEKSCLYLQSGGLVFQPAVYTLQKGSVFHRKHEGSHRKVKPA